MSISSGVVPRPAESRQLSPVREPGRRCSLRSLRSVPTPGWHWGRTAPALLKTHKGSCETGILVCIVIQHRSISSTATCGNLPSICHGR